MTFAPATSVRRAIALDVGQSGTRVCLLVGDGATGSFEQRTSLPELPGVRTDLPLIEQLTRIVATVVNDVGPIDTVAIGTTGLSDSDRSENIDHRVLHGVGAILLAHDSVTSYLGAVGNRPGVMVTAGTGVVTLSVGSGSVIRVDGWGNIMGDAGSGYWFGRSALEAAMRAYDGRGPGTLLLDRMGDTFGNVEGAYVELQSDPARVRRIASFSRWVTEAAGRGDVVAGEILRRGASELALSVTTALRRAGLEDSADPVICAIGGVLSSTFLRAAFVEALARQRSTLHLTPPAGDGLDGAVGLLAVAPASPLYTSISRTARHPAPSR